MKCFKCFFFFNLHQDGMAHLGLLPLRVEFVQTLCIADKLGFLDSIEHVAMVLHTQRQKPIKMPYISFPKLRNKLKKSPPPPQESAEQPCDGESLKDDSTVAIQEAEHPLPSSEQDDPNSFLKEKNSDVESAAETDSLGRLSSTSDKSDTSQELTVNCTHSPQPSNGVPPAIESVGLSGTTGVLQPPAAEELSTSESGCDTGNASRGGCGTGSELSAGGGGCGTGSELSASGGECGTGSELSASRGGRGTGSELSASGGGRGTGSELSASGGGRSTGSELSASGGGYGGKRRDKKHRRHPKTATHGGSKRFGRNKKQANCRTEKAKAPVILYYGMGAGRFRT